MSEKTRSQLVLPALRAHLGDWIYYITFMQMSEVAERISEVEHIHTSKSLQTFIQRQLDSSHSSEIAQFILSQPQRFFNSLVVGVYGGMPNWYELDIHGNEFIDPDNLPDYMEGSLGVLVLSGVEDLFAIDGQHRVVGIKKAVAENPSIGDEEIATIFVSHRNDAAGMERTRRLFTRLNRYAKPVSPLAKIALDEDDIVAIVTRQILDDFVPFQGRIATEVAGVAIPPTDQLHFTTVAALYKTHDIYLRSYFKRSRIGRTHLYRGKPIKWSDYKKTRPTEDEVETFYSISSGLWESFRKYFHPIAELTSREDAVQTYRNTSGGHLLYRPIGIMMTVEAVSQLLNQGFSVDSAVMMLASIPMIISEAPWNGLIWDNQSSRIMADQERRNAGVKLMIYSVGGDLQKLRTNDTKLKKELAGLLNRDPHDVELPKYKTD